VTLDYGLDQEAVTATATQAESPKVGMATRNACNRKQPEKYVPSMQGNKYQVALAQITTSLGSSEKSMAFTQMSVKLMNKGTHQRSDVVGIVMTQVLGEKAVDFIGKDMKQLYWQNSFKPIHWKSLTADQCKKVFESHIR
jgi:hypothetical protein